MGKGFVVLLLFIAYCRSCSCIEEPRCSKYEFEEKVLEKVLRFEHKMEIMANTLNEISTKVKDDIHNMKTELETRGGEQTTAFNQLEKNLQTEWTDMKKSFKDLSAKIPQSFYAFSAYDFSASRPSNGHTLVFTQTILNQDGVYSTATGKFTAPSDGVYEFHATLTPKHTKKTVRVEFKAGETAIGRFSVYDYRTPVSSSGSATARLKEGTQVYLRVTSVSSGFTFAEMCRLVYELAQTQYGGAHAFRSIDLDYFVPYEEFGHGTVTHNHKPLRKNELDVRKGDIVKFFGNRWDGYALVSGSKQANPGLVPAFKIEKIYKTYNYSSKINT